MKTEATKKFRLESSKDGKIAGEDFFLVVVPVVVVQNINFFARTKKS